MKVKFKIAGIFNLSSGSTVVTCSGDYDGALNLKSGALMLNDREIQKMEFYGERLVASRESGHNLRNFETDKSIIIDSTKLNHYCLTFDSV